MTIRRKRALSSEEARLSLKNFSKLTLASDKSLALVRELADMGILEPVNTVLDFNTRKVVTVWGWTGDQPLLVPIKEDKSHKKSKLYDLCYEQGVRDTLSYLYQGHISEDFVYDIVERRK